jgi:hypothetical protein
MKTLINHQSISQTAIDSGELAMLRAVIHNFSEPGEYQVSIFSDKLVVAVHILRVDEKSTAMQVNIDLSPPALATSDRTAAGCDCKDEKPGRAGDSCFIVNPRGQVRFFVSHGTDEYAVRVNRINDAKILFDSRQLQATRRGKITA